MSDIQETIATCGKHQWPAKTWTAKTTCCGSIEIGFIRLMEPAFCPECGDSYTAFGPQKWHDQGRPGYSLWLRDKV